MGRLELQFNGRSEVIDVSPSFEYFNIRVRSLFDVKNKKLTYQYEDEEGDNTGVDEEGNYQDLARFAKESSSDITVFVNIDDEDPKAVLEKAEKTVYENCKIAATDFIKHPRDKTLEQQYFKKKEEEKEHDEYTKQLDAQIAEEERKKEEKKMEEARLKREQEEKRQLEEQIEKERLQREKEEQEELERQAAIENFKAQQEPEIVSNNSDEDYEKVESSDRKSRSSQYTSHDNSRTMTEESASPVKDQATSAQKKAGRPNLNINTQDSNSPDAQQNRSFKNYSDQPQHTDITSNKHHEFHAEGPLISTRHTYDKKEVPKKGGNLRERRLKAMEKARANPPDSNLDGVSHLKVSAILDSSPAEDSLKAEILNESFKKALKAVFPFISDFQLQARVCDISEQMLKIFDEMPPSEKSKVDTQFKGLFTQLDNLKQKKDDYIQAITPIGGKTQVPNNETPGYDARPRQEETKISNEGKMIDETPKLQPEFKDTPKGSQKPQQEVAKKPTSKSQQFDEAAYREMAIQSERELRETKPKKTDDLKVTGFNHEQENQQQSEQIKVHSVPNEKYRCEIIKELGQIPANITSKDKAIYKNILIKNCSSKDAVNWYIRNINSGTPLEDVKVGSLKAGKDKKVVLNITNPEQEGRIAYRFVVIRKDKGIETEMSPHFDIFLNIQKGAGKKEQVPEKPSNENKMDLKGEEFDLMDPLALQVEHKIEDLKPFLTVEIDVFDMRQYIRDNITKDNEKLLLGLEELHSKRMGNK